MMKKRKMTRNLFLLLLTLLVLPVVSQADPGTNYCVKPPFISAGRTPNLLMIIDNSASMYDQGYTASSSATPPSYTCSTSGGPVTVTSSYCFDNTYDDTRDYEGYFSRFDSATNTISYPIYQFSDGKFVEVASIPATTGSNIYRTSFLYVEMTGSSSATPSTRAVSNFTASGRFLNWLTASKFDIEKKILTGGKYNPTSQLLMGESRGCDGRRFVKVVPGLSGITFAIRGPNAEEPNYNPSTQGGDSRIEIFEATYNASDCQCAVYNWTTGNYGQASTDTKGCLGTTPANSALSTLNHSQQTCWLLKDNIRKGATTDATLWQGINIQDIKTACDNVYTNNQNPIAPDALTDESNGNYICTSAKTNHPAPIAPYDVNGADTEGFVGTCWGGSSNKFTGKDGCIKREILHYCMGVNFSDVTDPSSGSSTAASSGIPSLLIDAGVRAISDPIGPSGSTDKFFYARATTSAPPTGVIQDYAGTIRFGAMSFNYAGSSSECGGTSLIPCPKFCSVKTDKMCVSNSDCLTGEGTCQAVTNNKDGGVMNTFIGDSVGDYSTGLINSINTLPATSWTPFAEAYYNAIAYFVKDATATNSNLAAAKFTPTASAIAAPLTGTDSYTNQNPIQYRCQLNNILLITDGASTADINSTMTGKVTDSSGVFRNPSTATEPATCGDYYGSPFLHDLSYFARHRNIFDPSKVCPAPSGSTYTCETAQTITTHAVYTGPVSASTTNMCDSYAQMRQTAIDGGTELKTPSNPTALRNDLKETLQKIAAGAASGTAASILSNSEGSGANMLQAVFYPAKIFEDKTAASWIGEMQNLWYYVDPYISNSTIREDTDNDRKLNLINDYVARFAFDTTLDKTMVQLYRDTNGDSIPDTAFGGPIDPDYVKSLWRSGKLLWARDITAVPRKIKTTLNGTSLIDFSSATFPGSPVANNAATLAPYLNVADTAAPTLIDWVHGQDQTGYRGRTVKIKDPATNVVSSGVWRLGDIISSTPRVQSTVRLNTYNLPPPGGYSDKTYEAYTNSSSYKNRGMVYVGANDGMFHAFKLGTLSVAATGFQKASLTNPDTTTPLGHEEWAFIPKNTLPYLRYMADVNYDHLYSIDGRTAIFDASIGNDGSGADYSIQTRTQSTWRTVVIGGMGLGGASYNSDSACDNTATGNCVKTPINGVGYSSYFAFDVTSPSNPVLLWEFSDPALGYATSGPAIVRVGDKSKNGRWYAVFGSGPTGPIDTASHQFLGTSSQNLKFFVIDLVTGTLVNTIDTGIANAFAGSMLGGAIDIDRSNSTVAGNYQDDAIYVGYVKKCVVDSGVCSGKVGSWVDGGVGRIMTMESQITSSPTASNWVWSKVVDGIGPVTTSIARTQDKKNRNLWLYFGTGRFYFRNVGSLDDSSGSRSLFAIKEPCYNSASSPGNFLDKTCSAAISGTLANQTTTIHTVDASDPGWRIDLDSATSTEGAERVVTDTVAMTNGTVYFTSFKPTTDLCGYGGNSFLWGVKYDTGGAADAKALLGKALIQLSTGEFKEVDLATAFTDKGNRRMLTPMTGKPPSDAPPIISNSMNRPLKKILHIKER